MNTQHSNNAHSNVTTKGKIRFTLFSLLGWLLFFIPMKFGKYSGVGVSLSLQ